MLKTDNTGILFKIRFNLPNIGFHYMNDIKYVAFILTTSHVWKFVCVCTY